MSEIKRSRAAEGACKGRVLLMDDEEIVREVAGEVLSSAGYDVTFAVNGEEAVALYKESLDEERGASFGLVILDLAVPGAMDGKQAMTEIKVLNPDVKAILSTGYTNDPVVSEYSIYGFTGLLCKPYSILELRNSVDNILSE